MDLAEVIRVIRTRWYVMVPLLLITIALTIGVDRSIPTKYQSTSEISLLASQSAIAGTDKLPGTGNPFLNYGSSLNDTADFLVRRLGSNDSATDLVKLGVTETYAVALAAAAQGPFITLTVTGSNPEHILTSMNTLTDYTVQQLAKVQDQAGVKPVDMIRSIVIVSPSAPAPQTKTKTQDVLGIAVGGLVITFLATFVVESILASRRRRRRRVPFGADGDEGFDADLETAAVEIERDDADDRPHANGNSNGNGRAAAATQTSASRWYGMDGAADLDRDPFEPAHPELSGRAPGTRD
ncbi:MAG TPA: hypothetical protein VFU65_07740 [Actinocrinis sp.]|nr:hypothetical protein [Actinocrinis sp.]